MTRDRSDYGCNLQSGGTAAGRQLVVASTTSEWAALDTAGTFQAGGTPGKVGYNSSFTAVASLAGVFELRQDVIPGKAGEKHEWSFSLTMRPWTGGATSVFAKTPGKAKLIPLPSGAALIELEDTVAGWSVETGVVFDLLDLKSPKRSGVATDGHDLVWNQLVSTGSAVDVDLMTAPYSLDPEKVAGGARRVTKGEWSAGTSVVGCGHVARLGGLSGLDVVRLQDGATFPIPRKMFAESFPHPYLITCEELFVSVEGAWVRIRLDALGPPKPPE